MPDSTHVQVGRSLGEIHKAASICVNRGLQIPALMLLYAGIDIAGWIDSTDPDESTRDTFTRWSDAYIHPEEKLGCSSLDLYGARCGLLHRAGADSHMAERGECRRIFYSWGWVHEADHQTVVDEIADEDVVVVHVHALLEAYRSGLAAYARDVRGYPEDQKAEVARKRGRVFQEGGDQFRTAMEFFLSRHEEEGG